MAKDPAFLFYPGDASDDTQFMNRLERGCYFDLLKAQKKHRKFSIDLVKKVLGRDFDACWPAIELVLQKDGELYFIGWVDDAIENRAAHAAKQKKRIKEWWDKKKSSETVPQNNQNNTTEQPPKESGKTLENEIVNESENGNGNEIGDKGVQGEFTDEWFREIFDEVHMGNVRSTFPKHNIDNEFKIFQLKVRGSPDDYRFRDTGGIRNAFNYQLQKSTSINVNGHNTKTSTRQPPTDNGQGKKFGSWE